MRKLQRTRGEYGETEEDDETGEEGENNREHVGSLTQPLTKSRWMI